MSVARADEAQARSLLKAMSDYLGAQKTISFEYDTNLEIVKPGAPEDRAGDSGNLNSTAPTRFRTRTGGFANVEMVFDGKSLTLLGKNANPMLRSGRPAQSINWSTSYGTSTTDPCRARIY